MAPLSYITHPKLICLGPQERKKNELSTLKVEVALTWIGFFPKSLPVVFKMKNKENTRIQINVSLLFSSLFLFFPSFFSFPLLFFNSFVQTHIISLSSLHQTFPLHFLFCPCSFLFLVFHPSNRPLVKTNLNSIKSPL